MQDVEAFRANSLELGIAFGSMQEANGYRFANAKDPVCNSAGIFSRRYRRPA